MTQPEKPALSRGTRPQLFKEAASPRPRSNRQPDFGPSILATIDGGQPRHSASRDRVSIRRVLFMAAVALTAVALYLGVKLTGSRSSAAPSPVVAAVQMPAPAPVVVAKAIEPPVMLEPPAGQASAAQGAASIENVPPPVQPASSAASVLPASEPARADMIRQALDRSEPEPTVPPKSTNPPERPQATRVATRGTAAAPASPKPKAKPSSDNDAELLAAMLPHLKRNTGSPTSPAYDKRCGQLVGEAEVDCRAKFCNGREGADAACPVPVQAGEGDGRP